jgi:hypothetical protein
MKNFHKLLSLLLVLTFAAQGLIANAVPCQMPLNIEAMVGAVDMTAMDHATHRMPAGAADAAESTGNANCCDVGLCAIGYCQSAVALPLHHSANSPEYASVYARLSAITPAIPVNDSLYRPPIFR